MPPNHDKRLFFLLLTLPLFEVAFPDTVPTVVDVVTAFAVSFDVPVVPDAIFTVEADGLVPMRDVVAVTNTPEPVITGMVLVTDPDPVCTSLAEMPIKMPLSALSALVMLLAVGL